MDASNMDVTIDHIAKDGGKLKAFAMVIRMVTASTIPTASAATRRMTARCTPALVVSSALAIRLHGESMTARSTA